MQYPTSTFSGYWSFIYYINGVGAECGAESVKIMVGHIIVNINMGFLL